MDLSKYEKIEGGFDGMWECLKAGVTVTLQNGVSYKLDEEGTLLSDYRQRGRFARSSLEFNLMLCSDWYVKKPFDVRQAMRDKPNEWVGAFESEDNWYKVGFDSGSFKAVLSLYEFDDIPSDRKWGVTDATRAQLEICIPIQDVPEEATR